jgi:beta-lactamase superfamily II metal-dependent hydrolase
MVDATLSLALEGAAHLKPYCGTREFYLRASTRFFRGESDMSVIRSFSVGDGDMFYIDHNTDNFSMIDCCLDEDRAEVILDEISSLSKKKGVTRFISTHPDDDHIGGLELLDDKIGILNFYCVKNKATKEDETDSFTRYCELRDHEKKAFYIYQGCKRRWMNESDAERNHAGISILWPDTAHEEFQTALKTAEEGGSPNNISPIIKYSVADGAAVLWMGDLATEFLEAIADDITLPVADIVFAPHHGRGSGRIPASMLDELSPRIIIVGEAPSEDLCYYQGYHTITQNSAGDIIFDCQEGAVHIFTSNEYEVGFLDDWEQERAGYYYLGTLDLSKKR